MCSVGAWDAFCGSMGVHPVGAWGCILWRHGCVFCGQWALMAAEDLPGNQETENHLKCHKVDRYLGALGTRGARESQSKLE